MLPRQDFIGARYRKPNEKHHYGFAFDADEYCWLGCLFTALRLSVSAGAALIEQLKYTASSSLICISLA